MNSWLDSVQIRLLRETDLPQLEWDGEYARYRRVYREVFRNYSRGISRPFIAETAQNGIIGQVFLTEKGPNAAYSACDPYFFLSSFRIKSDFRDRGLGSLLLRVCEITASDKKIKEIYLNCAKTNARGLHFYQSHGFKILREDAGLWSFINENGKVVTESEPAWTLHKWIAPDM